MSPDEAKERILEEAAQELNLARVTILLVENIHIEDFRREKIYLLRIFIDWASYL